MNPSGSQDVEMQNSSQPNIVSSMLSQSAHPSVCVAHFGFKIPCLIVYFLGGWFGYAMTFILVTLMLAFDFWVVKNVSGRILVQLRWWNEIKEDGDSEWYKTFDNINSEHQYKSSNTNCLLYSSFFQQSQGFRIERCRCQ